MTKKVVLGSFVCFYDNLKKRIKSLLRTLSNLKFVSIICWLRHFTRHSGWETAGVASDIIQYWCTPEGCNSTMKQTILFACRVSSYSLRLLISSLQPNPHFPLCKTPFHTSFINKQIKRINKLSSGKVTWQWNVLV